jgi:energy-coupling factor transport system permease protein
VLAFGVVASLTGLHRANRRAVRTVYRPDPWRWPESATVASGLVATAAYTATAVLAPTSMLPGTNPLTWPALPMLPLLATLLAAAPAWIAPPVPTWGEASGGAAVRRGPTVSEPAEAVAA